MITKNLSTVRKLNKLLDEYALESYLQMWGYKAEMKRIKSRIWDLLLEGDNA